MGTLVKKLEKFDRPKKQGLTVTVSGLAGSGKTTIAQIIAQETGLEYVSAGKIFRDLAKKNGVTLEQFSATRSKDVDYMIDQKTLELARKGGVVLDGRITGWVAGTHAQIKIYTKAEDQEIAQRVALRDNKTLKKALKDVQDRNKSDVKAYKKTYGIDATNQTIYNYVLDNTFPTYKEIREMAKLIAEIVKKRFSKQLKTFKKR